ncbi:MAG: hypothetical protein KZQ59_07800, partial [Candidatus Thiodiazotropha sp. (ex Lucinoma aequizonata)]|nr:hypothetical protein [Candidatus Thiodiazotropha sp. (ex Lucinoma aequizonata)]
MSLFVKGKLSFEVEQPLKAISAHGVGGESNNTYLICSVIIQLKNWKKCLTRFFCIFSDFKEDCLPTS